VRKYAILGVPGSGKSTQSTLLARDLDLVHISAGDDFRWHVENHTKIGARVRPVMAAGRLIDDELVESVMRGRLEQHDWNHGFVIDGFPRNRRQAEFLLENYDLDAVVYLDLPDSEVRDRVLSRLGTREDDTPEALTERLRDHRGNTDPALESLRRRTSVFVIDASRDPDTVQRDIRTRLGLSPV
jgi:adenylate kinase